MNGFFKGSALIKQKPAGMIPKCGSCGLFKTCSTPKMEPYGEGEKKILFLGEAPGQTEDEEGRPFIGKAGQFLRDTLSRLGIDMDDDAWTTNALICRPPGNKTPDPKQISYCFPNLRNTISKLQPRVVITLGRVPLSAMLTGFNIWQDVGNLERWTGWQIPLKEHWLCPTFHPSFLMRTHSPILEQMFSNHLEAAFELNKAPAPLEVGKIDLVLDEEEAAERILAMDQDGAWLAVDYETNCIKPEWPQAHIFSCAMSNGEETISYPWSTAAAKVTSEVLQSKKTRKIASNLKMEERWTYKHLGHKVRNWGWDTMLAAHCLDNRTGVCSLKFQSLVRMGVPQYNTLVEGYLSSSRGPYNHIHEIKITDLLRYGGEDAFYEYELAMLQRKDLGFES